MIDEGAHRHGNLKDICCDFNSVAENVDFSALAPGPMKRVNTLLDRSTNFAHVASLVNQMQ